MYFINSISMISITIDNIVTIIIFITLTTIIGIYI